MVKMDCFPEMEFLREKNQLCACMGEKCLRVSAIVVTLFHVREKWATTASVSEECRSLPSREGNWVRDLTWESMGSNSDSSVRTDSCPYSPFPKAITAQLLLGELSGWLNKTRKVVGS